MVQKSSHQSADKQTIFRPMSTVARAASSSALLGLPSGLGNRAIQRLLQRQPSNSAGEPQEPESREAQGKAKPPSKTVYMGMNAGGRNEAALLKGLIKDDLLADLNDPTLEKTLETEVGVVDWLSKELPLLLDNSAQFLKAYDALVAVDAQARDQVAQLYKMFYAAEQGDYTLERLVLSGHSNGISVWGDDRQNFTPGSFALTTDMKNLASVFPTAAGQVQDVMFSACFTVSSIELVLAAFPNVRTIWAYSDKSPAAGQGAEEHIQQWEKATQGDQTLEESDGRGMSALWTRDAFDASKANKGPDGKEVEGNGFVRNDPAKAPLQALQKDFLSIKVSAYAQLMGESPLDHFILNNAYRYAQMIYAHPDTKKDPAAYADVANWRDKLLRLRFYEQLSLRFATTYASQIKEGYAAIGRKVPELGVLSRKSQLAEMDAFAAALKDTPNAEAQTFYDTYLNGLRTLNTTLIPDDWI